VLKFKNRVFISSPQLSEAILLFLTLGIELYSNPKV
jgi:hypothetical protein